MEVMKRSVEVKYRGGYREVTKGLQRFYKGARRVLHVARCKKGITRVLQACYNGVTRMLQKCVTVPESAEEPEGELCWGAAKEAGEAEEEELVLCSPLRGKGV
jgi:hypothetical protein